MARKRFKAGQIGAILREVERAGDRQEVVRKHGISDQTYCRGSTQLMPRRGSAPRIVRGAALSLL